MEKGEEGTGEKTEEEYGKRVELERRKTEGKRGGEGFKNEKNMSEETKGTWGQARGWIKTSTKLGYKWLSCTSRHM